MSNQSLRQASVRASTGTAYHYEGDWIALFDAAGIASGFFNERMLAWINAQLSTAYTNVNDAMQAFAEDQGATSWNELGVFNASSFHPSDLFDASQQGAVFDASSSVFTDTGGTTPAVANDAVARISDLSGNGLHMTQSTSGARPTLKTSGALAYLETDGAGNFMTSAASMSLGPVPLYIWLAFEQAEASAGKTMFGALVNTTNFARILSLTTSRITAATRASLLGFAQESVTSNVSDVPINTKTVAIFRISAGQSGLLINNNAEITAANSWTGLSSVANCGVGLSTNDLATTSNMAMKFYAGGLIEKALSAGEVSNLKTWLGNKVGLTL